MEKKNTLLWIAIIVLVGVCCVVGTLFFIGYSKREKSDKDSFKNGDFNPVMISPPADDSTAVSEDDDDGNASNSTSYSTADLPDYNWLAKRWLDESDLSGYSKSELRILRNSIYARYGYKFKSEDLKKHFAKFPWYKGKEPDEGKVYNRMSETEKHNIAVIKGLEDGGGYDYDYDYDYDYGYDGDAYEDFPSYLFSRELTYSDISGLSKAELRILRNYIYAANGYIFKSPDLREYFSRFSWYSPRYSNEGVVWDNFSAIEKHNVQFIKSYE